MSTFIRNLFCLLILLPAVWFYGCAAGPQEPDKAAPTVTTTVYGQVVDEAGQPVAGATVTAHSATAVTDGKGLFVLKNATVPETRLVVTAKKAGYFTAARAESPRKGSSTRTTLFLMANTASYSVPSSGGTVNVAGGASLAFQAGSFKTSTGAAYSGTVRVAARYLDPESMSFGEFFSGDNLAQTANGSEVGLTSCGVLRVEIAGQNGEALQLDATKPATISYPKPANNTSAPNTMPLWYFDETLGMWKEDGSATVQGNAYVGTVSHFTDWNLDYPGAYGTVEFRVVCNGVPIPGVAVKFKGFDHKVGYTESDGTIRFVRVPADKEIEIYIRAIDNDGIYFVNTPVKAQIVPNETTKLPDIVLNSPCPASISGTLIDCEGAPAEGLVVIESGSDFSYVYAKGGVFSLVTKSGVPLTVRATDVNGNEAEPVNVLALAEGEIHQVGAIKICGDGTEQFKDIVFPAIRNSFGMKFSPDGSLLAVLNYDQPNMSLTVYESATGNKLMEKTLGGATYSSTLQFSTDNKKLLVINVGCIVYDISAGSLTEISTLPNAVYAQMYDDGSKYIATVKQGQNTIYGVYNSSDASLIKEIHPPINFAKDSNMVFTLIQSEDAIIFPDHASNWHIWSVAGDNESRAYTFPGHSQTALISDEGAAVGVTADWKEYGVYSTATGLLLKTLSMTVGGTINYNVPAISKEYGYVPIMNQGIYAINAIKFSDGSSKIKILSGAEHLQSVEVSRGDEYLAALHPEGIRIWKLK